MKKIFLILLTIVVSMSVFSQTPNGFSYQAIVRDSENNLVKNSQVGLKISILQYTPEGSVVFSEYHFTTTNLNGLLSIIIGEGEKQYGYISKINWSDGPFFIKTETDPTGGTNYTIEGISQLLSVPYAFNAKTADGLNGGEQDPVFNSSLASDITATDTSKWNNKSDFDGDFASLYNAPNIANSTDNKTIQLNTSNANSSLSIDNSNGNSVFKVDGSGRMTGDGSGLSNVRPMINTIGGNQRVQLTANYGTYQNIRTVTLTVPSKGMCFVMASGYLDWESTGWDLYLGGILMDENPNSSWTAENNWYSYLNIATDYNCTDSSDQYTSFAQHRTFNVNAGTHTFTLWANKYTSSSKTELGDVNLTVIFIPTGGTGKQSDDIPEPVIDDYITPNSVNGED